MKRVLLLAALCLFSVPVKADLVPNNGTVAVYGDFTQTYGGSITASFGYTATGGSFSKPYDYSDPLAVNEQIVINIWMNNTGHILSINCSQLDAHCGRNDRNNPFFSVGGYDGVGFINVSSSVWTTGGATAPELSLYVNLPTGFSLVAPAVPEPSTWIMMLAGFALISSLRLARSQYLCS